MSGKHVLFISSWYPAKHKSAGTFVELHLLALQARGCKCAMLLTGETTLGNYVRHNFNRDAFLDFRRRDDIQFVDNLVVHKSPLRFAANPIEKRKKNIFATSKKNIERYIQVHGKPDVIFHHGVFDYCYLTSYLSAEFDIPVWYMENSPNMSEGQIPCANPFDSYEDLLDFPEKVVRRFAVTESYVQKMKSLFGVDFELCPNVITDDFFVNPEFVKRDENTFQFVNVGILDPRKNQRLILEAFAQNFKGQRKFSLAIAGDGPLQQELEKYAVELGIHAQTKILGFQNRSEIVQLLDASHCFVLASHSETFGVVVIEAMARALPAISSDIDGTREIFNGENGCLFEPDNARGLARAMKQVVDAYQDYKPASIVRSVKDNFGPDAVYNALFGK